MTLTPADLDRYRAVQKLAYKCAEEIATGLEPGVTERQAASRMTAWLTAHGVSDWFHLPLAWFGDRTAFRGIKNPFKLLLSDRRLERGMPFILDCAPVVDGYPADIGYASCLGENPALDRILDDLAEHRVLILDLVKKRRPLREIYEAVDRLATRQGHDNRHQVYPGRVLAHQVGKLPTTRSRTVFGFGLNGLTFLARTLVRGRLEGWSPLWADGRASDHPPMPGVWAVEPHLGFRGVGAKFEELLVVTESDAYWLDDDLPHVRRWAARGLLAAA